MVETQSRDRCKDILDIFGEPDPAHMISSELVMKIAGRTALYDVTLITINKATGAIEESVKGFSSRPVEFPVGWD